MPGLEQSTKILQKYSKTCSDAGTRTRVSCVRGKYAKHLHHIGVQLDDFGNAVMIHY
jgi:hypothetical protein